MSPNALLLAFGEANWLLSLFINKVLNAIEKFERRPVNQRCQSTRDEEKLRDKRDYLLTYSRSDFLLWLAATRHSVSLMKNSDF